MSVGRRRFRIIKEIAEGGFGKVYLAEQISSDGFSRIVAVKLLHAKWSSHDEVVMRTRDEARLLGLIRHQHIVKVEDLTSIDGKCAIVMEYLEGVDLKWMISFLKERNLVFPRAALFEIVLAVASALDAAYNGTPLQGGDSLHVIHRDIKPSNIFVTVAGGVKVLDFGTARANFAEREAKTQALAFGSQGYMAPERMLGEEDTPAADVFSLGVSLYELLALESFGRIPPRPNKFASKVEDRIASIQLEGSPEWCNQVRDTLRLMLSYEPENRPTAAQLVEIMEALAQDANDMQLRRFCRTLVAEAKEKLPELDTGDPLAGTIVDEDASASFGPPRTAEASAPVVLSGVLGQSPMASGPAKSPPMASNPAASGASSAASYPAVPGVTGEVSTEEGGGKRGIGMLLVAGVAVVVLLVGGITVAGGLGLAFMVSQEGGGATTTDAVTPKPVEKPAPQPAAPEGGRITSQDSRADVAKVPTVLKFGDAAGASVTIRGGGGFAAEWDGKADFDLGQVADGRYSTVIELPSGKKVRGKSFTVETQKKKKCEFTFDVGAEDWKGGCS